jgi:hypothetical protein
VLVGPLKAQNTQLQQVYEQALSGKMRMVPIDQPVLRKAAELRASVASLRTPDAIHAVTSTDTATCRACPRSS